MARCSDEQLILACRIHAKLLSKTEESWIDLNPPITECSAYGPQLGMKADIIYVLGSIRSIPFIRGLSTSGMVTLPSSF